MVARIYKPSKTSMSSGRARTKEWVLEFCASEHKVVDPLMGWTGSGDTQTQVKLEFETKDDAISYARKHGLAYEITEDVSRNFNIRPKGYSDNFSYTRRTNWTH